MQIVYDRKSYEQDMYRRALRRDANHLGGLMLSFFWLEIVVSIIITFILSITGVGSLTSDTVAEMVESNVISTVIFFLGALVFALIRRMDFAEAFPFEKVGFKKTAMMVTVGLTVTLMANYIADLVTQVFGIFGTENDVEMSFSTDTGFSVALYFFTIAVIPALVEEFAFRGVVLGTLRKYSDGLAVIVTAGLFALMHGNFVQIPFTFVGGLAFGYVVVKTNSMLPAILIHFFNNGLAVLTDVLESNQILSSEYVNILWNAILLILTIASICIIRCAAIHHRDWFRFEKADEVIPYRRKLGTVCSSPTIIIFATTMILYAIIILLM